LPGESQGESFGELSCFTPDQTIGPDGKRGEVRCLRQDYRPVVVLARRVIIYIPPKCILLHSFTPLVQTNSRLLQQLQAQEKEFSPQSPCWVWHYAGPSMSLVSCIHDFFLAATAKTMTTPPPTMPTNLRHNGVYRLIELAMTRLMMVMKETWFLLTS
jgi:hypothetical protein